MSEIPEIKLARKPLVLTLAQVKFAPIKFMRKYVPCLQDHFRKQGFPRYDEIACQQFTFSAAPEIVTTQRWAFGSLTKKDWITVSEDFVSFETSEFDLFPGFLSKVVNAVKALSDALKSEGGGDSISFVTQIGLRYLDLIRPLDGHAPEWFLKPEVRGLSASALGAEEVMNQFVNRAITPEGELWFRGCSGKGKFSFPFGLDLDRHEINVELSDDEPYWMLDFDHIWRGEFAFDENEIAAKVKKLNDLVFKAFYAATSEDGLSVWKVGGES